MRHRDNQSYQPLLRWVRLDCSKSTSRKCGECSQLETEIGICDATIFVPFCLAKAWEPHGDMAPVRFRLNYTSKRMRAFAYKADLAAVTNARRLYSKEPNCLQVGFCAQSTKRTRMLC